MEIIAVDDDPILLHTIRMVLESEFGDILTLEHPSLIENHIDLHAIKVIILDLNFAIGASDGSEGLGWLSKLRQTWKDVSIVVLTAHGFVDVAVKSLKQGATDFVEKPFSNEKFIATIMAARNLAESKMQLTSAKSANDTLLGQLSQPTNYVTGKSPSMHDIYQTVQKVAPTDAAILISGEHGAGKEVLARLIHQSSHRVSGPFMHIDLSAISEQLFESTLFGHIKGSFTDAVEDKTGLLELANGGTAFLDGIGNIPLHLQSKLLKCLQNQEVTRIGENYPRALDSRVISSTHLPISTIADDPGFRQDLFFRINTVTLEIPPLRDRIRDIKPLAQHFMDRFNDKYERKMALTRNDLQLLEKHEWPGNVRELKNTIERMVIMDQKNTETTLLNEFKPPREHENLYELEKSKIAEVIARYSGNMSRAAQELGIGRNTLYRKIKKYGL